MAQAVSQVSVPGRNASVEAWGPESRQFTVGEGDKASAQIRTFFYPYWELRTVEGNVLNTHAGADGVLVADIPSGPQTIKMKFVHPRHQQLANLASLAGLGMIAAMTLMRFRKRTAVIA